MLGGAGTIVLVVVMRVLVARQWHAGIGLNPKRRLLLPAIALVIGLLGLRRGGSEVFDGARGLLVVLALVVAVAAGVIRARTVTRSRVPETELYPGGLRLTGGTVTLATDLAAVLIAAALILPAVAQATGLHPAAGAWTLTVAIGDLVASGLLLRRAAPAR